jgi:hypothetical protein
LNPGRRGGKPATNRLSYGAACLLLFFSLFNLLLLIIIIIIPLFPLFFAFLFLSPSFLCNILTSELCVQGLKKRQVQLLSSGNNTRLELSLVTSPRRMCAVILIVIRGIHDGLGSGRLAVGTRNPGK